MGLGDSTGRDQPAPAKHNPGHAAALEGLMAPRTTRSNQSVQDGAALLTQEQGMKGEALGNLKAWWSRRMERGGEAPGQTV